MLKLRAWNSITKKWRWINAPKQGVSDPVIISFDDPDFATGVNIPYPTGAYPTELLIEVTEVFDSLIVQPLNQDDENIDANGEDAEITQIGLYISSLSSFNDSSKISEVKLQTDSTPTQGSLTARVVYLTVT